MYIEEEILGKFESVKNDRKLAEFFLRYMFYSIATDIIVALSYYQGFKAEQRLRKKYITLTAGIEKLSEALNKLSAKEDGVWKEIFLKMFMESAGGAIVRFNELQLKRKISFDEMKKYKEEKKFKEDITKSFYEARQTQLKLIKQFIDRKTFDK
ncbi:MAG: hypothetical protein ABSB40_10875 [Nitrososphaeria archaeon]|jgi:hypothetical protein